MTINYIDTALQAAVVADTTQQDECAAILAAFAGDVTIRIYSATTHLSTVTHAPFTIDPSTPRKLIFGMRNARTFVSAGTATEARFFDGSTERFRCPLTLSAPVSADSADRLNNGLVVLSANPAKPEGSGGLTGPAIPNTSFTTFFAPLSGDYELRQPKQTLYSIVSSVPSSGSVMYHDGLQYIACTVGTELTPARFASLIYRPSGGAHNASAGNFAYTVGGLTNTVAITLKDWAQVTAIRSARLRIFDAATGGTQLFEGSALFNQVPSDPLGNFKSGPLPSSVETIGYQYIAIAGPINVTAPVAKSGYSVWAYLYYTPSNGLIETHFECWPNAAGKWPFRTDASIPAWTPAADDRSLLNVEIDLLDAGGAVYTASGEKVGRLRGTTTGADETRIKLTAGSGAWWWNKAAPIINVENNARLIYPHKMTATNDMLGGYQNQTSNGNFFLDPRYPLGGNPANAHWGYMSPGEPGALTTNTPQGGLSHDREPYHLAEMMVLQWGANAGRRITTSGAATYGQMMLDIADTAANGLPVVLRTEPKAGPMDAHRYASNMRNFFIARSSTTGAFPYGQNGTELGLSNFPVSGCADLAIGAANNNFQLDQAHFYTASCVAYATTGCVRYLQTMQYAPITTTLSTNPATRDGLIQGAGVQPYYRVWVRPVMELFKAAQFAPQYPDGMWLSSDRLHEIVAQTWANADSYFAAEEASTDTTIRPAWKLGMRPFDNTVLSSNAYAEPVRPSSYGTNQSNWPGQTADANIYGWVNHPWDAAYIVPHFLMLKKSGKNTASQNRFIRKLVRYAIGGALHFPQAVMRHPCVIVDRAIGTFAEWDSVKDLVNPWATGAVNGTAALVNSEPTTMDYFRTRRGEPDNSATINIEQNASRTFTLYLWWEVLEAVAREFPAIAAETEFSTEFAPALAWYRRQMGYVKAAIAASESAWTSGQAHYLLLANTSLATGDAIVNQTQGAYYLTPGQMCFSLAPTGPTNPKIWQASGVDA